MGPKATSLLSHAWTAAAAKPLVALALVATVGAAAAAIAVTYTTSSSVTTSVMPAPVQFLAGDDAGPATLSSYVPSYAISTNRTNVQIAVKGVPEATLVVGSLFKLQNADATNPHTVTLSTPQVSNAFVSAYKFEIYDASNALQGTLTATAAAPSASFTMPAGATHSAKLTLTLASGAGADNVALSNAVTLSTV